MKTYEVVVKKYITDEKTETETFSIDVKNYTEINKKIKEKIKGKYWAYKIIKCELQSKKNIEDEVEQKRFSPYPKF